MKDVSVLIPARHEQFLARTIEDVLENASADTEVIAICDGYWPEPPISDHPKVTIVHHTESIGQRAATNEAARISQAKYIMKLDAHCSVSKGFDTALMADCQPDWTMIPSMYKLHIFDWKCQGCGEQTYQGFKPEKCGKCPSTEFEMVIVWTPKRGHPTVSWRFDDDIHFQYWRNYCKQPGVDGDLIETMSCVGCCMFMERDRFWELGGMDESHGSWGQFGSELACKAWLSGGKLMATRKAWIAHLFRTGNFRGNGEVSFPYPLSAQAQERARVYSKDLWRNNKWPGQKHPLSWLVEKFWPVPGWTDESLHEQKQREV